MENELVAVDVNTFWIFDISKDGETKNDLLIRANNYRKREIKDSYERLVHAENENSENITFYKDMYNRALNIHYEVMTFDDLMKLKKVRYMYFLKMEKMQML